MHLIKSAISLAYQVWLLLLWLIVRILFPRTTEPDQSKNSIWVFPADPGQIVGSKGDEAMLMGALSKITQNAPRSRIAIACSSASAVQFATSIGCDHFTVWGGKFMPFAIWKKLRTVAPAVTYFMGADMMDGHYSSVTSLRMVIASDLSAKSGAKARFMGFSLNSNPPFLLKWAFRRLDSRVVVNLRDPISFARYRSFGCKNGRLVADTAFLLQPTKLADSLTPILHWTQEMRKSNRTIIGINFHPMLFDKADARRSLTELIGSMSAGMKFAMSTDRFAWLLIPHDDRKHAGDIDTLAELHDVLPSEVKQFAYRISSPPSASALKEISGLTDGVITGRMHLAIAALGQEIPVMTFGYQGKFEGLVQHFELPAWVVIDPTEAKQAEFLQAKMHEFFCCLPQLKTMISKNISNVMKAANSTFDLP